MNEIFYDLTKPNSGANYRWIQPPQVAYFVTTTDIHGNVNSAPVTLGTCVSVDMEPDSCGNYFFTFAVGSSDLPHVLRRDTQKNLEEVPECVISYIGSNLLRETQIACLPLPWGISEIEIMGLTELHSKNVRPPGVKECKVNIEAKIISSTPIGLYYCLYVCQAVGLSVDETLVYRDAKSELHAGIVELDPLFEITVLGPENSPPRIYTVNLDMDSVQRLPDDFGPSRTFTGKFEDWMEDEVTRGKITQEECDDILALKELWRTHPEPGTNAEIKAQLTKRLRALLI